MEQSQVLVCASRGVSYRPRYLLQDIIDLLPHSVKESKFDDKKNLRTLNEIADINDCDKVVFLETKHKTDNFLWVSSAPDGPSVKFQMLNEHTKGDLKLTGNHLKGSKNLLSFDQSFETHDHLKSIRKLLEETFIVPDNTKAAKPFFDHIIAFSYLDGKIWLRTYQIISEEEEVKLAEVGPRCVLNPIKIFAKSFCGEPVWSNPDYVTPGQVRRIDNANKRKRHLEREDAKRQKEFKKLKEGAFDELGDVFD